MSGQDPPGAPLGDDDVDHLLGQLVHEQMAQMRHREHEQMLMMQHQMVHLQRLQEMARMQGGAHMVPGVAPPVVPSVAQLPGLVTNASSADAPVDGLFGLKIHCPLRTQLPHSCQE